MIRPTIRSQSPKQPAIVTGTDQDDSIALAMGTDRAATVAAFVAHCRDRVTPAAMVHPASGEGQA